MEKRLASTIQDEMLAACQAIATKHNVAITKSGGSLGTGKATLKFDIQVLSESGTPEMGEMERGALVVEIKHPAININNVAGFKFKDRDGRELTIVGFNYRAPKMPVILSNSRGQRSKCAGGYVRQNLPYQPVQTT